MFRCIASLLATVVTAPAAMACDLALLLAVDVSGSVDPAEYRIQMDGLALALVDPVVSEALVRAQAEVALVQWTGASRQETTLPWRRMSDFAAVQNLSDDVREATRPWRHFSTAIGEAMHHGRQAFAAVPHCTRRVMDISGDGVSNEGPDPKSVRESLRRDGITVNALVIETRNDDLTGWFWENVITGEGAFVVTANGFADYPDRIREKLAREISRQLAATHLGESGRF